MRLHGAAKEENTSCKDSRGGGEGYLVYLSDGDVAFFMVSFSTVLF